MLKCGRNNSQKDTTSACSARTKPVYCGANLDAFITQQLLRLTLHPPSHWFQHIGVPYASTGSRFSAYQSAEQEVHANTTRFNARCHTLQLTESTMERSRITVRGHNASETLRILMNFLDVPWQRWMAPMALSGGCVSSLGSLSRQYTGTLQPNWAVGRFKKKEAIQTALVCLASSCIVPSRSSTKMNFNQLSTLLTHSLPVLFLTTLPTWHKQRATN